MATESQIAANRKNAESSTGPRTEEGRTASSRNSLTLGLYTQSDYVRPEERDLYNEFRETMYSELSPEGLLEESFVAEITGATWRLRRCSAVEAELGEYADVTDHTRRSVERARAHAHSLLNRSVNQLRKLQTERTCRVMLNATGGEEGLADYKQVVKATNDYERAKHLYAKSCQIQGDAAIHQALNPPTLPDKDLASFCKGDAPSRRVPEVPRNAPCPCNSGKKYKACCARTGDGWPAAEAA